MQNSHSIPESPREAGYYMPAEWTPHESCWLAWPSAANLWEENLKPAQDEFTALCKAIVDLDPVTQKTRGESLHVLVPTLDAEKDARFALQGLPVQFHSIPFGDIWLRDIAPLFLKNKKPELGLATVRFAFNGWGEKYILPFDDQVSSQIAKTANELTSVGVPQFSFPWVLEGGSIELDGEGTCLTSKQCLLNPNRHPGKQSAHISQKEIENQLAASLSVNKVLWLNEGLLNDHTDGHIDTIARFVAPGKVVCMKAVNPESDPNHSVYEEIARDLASFSDAKGRTIEVIRIPSPGAILNEEGEVMAASYLNFYIANTTVVVPTYGSDQDENAVKAIAALFPTRKTVGLSAYAILSGGGAFHCISQQQPRK